ncbi:MAG: hypothetical protein A2X12_00790 [Bacteroidetes bacterium GWE2_29_8]|nr:MAG: hypothetical protein A2X12_00790 [Bacteroidetes bacterium GWE2_29_8]
MKIYKYIATGLGTGYSPIAPGTVGSILGLIITFLVSLIFNNLNFSQSLILTLNSVAIIFVMLIGVLSINKVHKVWIHDSPKIVIDEIVGVWIAVFAIPFKWQYYFCGLVLFRFFDIVKPLFIKRIDRMKGDWSVMLDDVLAGIYANILLQILIYSFPNIL